MITIGLGIAIFNETVSLLGPGLNFFWVYFVYAVGYIGMNLILSLVYTYTKKKIPEEKSCKLYYKVCMFSLLTISAVSISV